MQKEKLINAKNWTHTYYKSSNLKALIHIGALPEQGPHKKIQIIYLLTVLKETEKDAHEKNQENGQESSQEKSYQEEIYQAEFLELDNAISAINKRYSHWDFSDQEAPSRRCNCRCS